MKMAQQQAPPAAQAPIVVVVDEVQITSDAMLVLVPGAQALAQVRGPSDDLSIGCKQASPSVFKPNRV